MTNDPHLLLVVWGSKDDIDELSNRGYTILPAAHYVDGPLTNFEVGIAQQRAADTLEEVFSSTRAPESYMDDLIHFATALRMSGGRVDRSVTAERLRTLASSYDAGEKDVLHFNALISTELETIAKQVESPTFGRFRKPTIRADRLAKKLERSERLVYRAHNTSDMLKFTPLVVAILEARKDHNYYWGPLRKRSSELRRAADWRMDSNRAHETQDREEVLQNTILFPIAREEPGGYPTPDSVLSSVYGELSNEIRFAQPAGQLKHDVRYEKIALFVGSPRQLDQLALTCRTITGKGVPVRVDPYGDTSSDSEMRDAIAQFQETTRVGSDSSTGQQLPPGSFPTRRPGREARPRDSVLPTPSTRDHGKETDHPGPSAEP